MVSYLLLFRYLWLRMRVKDLLYIVLFFLLYGCSSNQAWESRLKQMYKWQDEKVCHNFADYTVSSKSPYQGIMANIIKLRGIESDPRCRDFYQNRLQWYIDRDREGNKIPFKDALALWPPAFVPNGIAPPRKVIISLYPPGDSYMSIGPISSVSGRGCGAFGYTGTYEGAVQKLKEKAIEMLADYVHMYKIGDPYSAGECNTYTIIGEAYRKI